jgi:hypothetical protein
VALSGASISCSFFLELHEMEALKEKVTMSELAENSHQSDPVKRARLRWRARRGLLENDLILTVFWISMKSHVMKRWMPSVA